MPCRARDGTENSDVSFRLELRLTDGPEGPPVAAAALEIHRSHGDPKLISASDAQGAALIEFPSAPRHLSVKVRREGFVPKIISFNLEATATSAYTLAMERAQTIGGLVRNEKGEPVGDATVLLIIRGSSSDHVEPRVYNDIFQAPAPTGADGRWKFDEAPQDLTPLHVRLVHPDYISHEEIHPLPALEEFVAGTAVLTLQKGVPCEGTVTDADGRTIEGVTVIFGEGGQDSCATPRRVTDAQGRFRFGSVPIARRGRALIVSFWKEGYAPELLELRLASTVIDASVVLRPGKALRLRFTDSTGQPVPGVMMALMYWREHRPASFVAWSDASGLAEWKNAPADAVGLTVVHETFQRVDVKFTADDEVHAVVLQRPTIVTGRVVDARTKQPLPAFRVVKGRHFPDLRHGWSHWGFHAPLAGREGTFRVEFREPAAMSNPQGGPGEAGFHRVRIDADGYRPGISRPIANEEENATLDFELEPGAATEGTVRDSAGRPVPGAQVVIAGPGNPVMIHSGKVARPDYLHVSVNEQGRFSLPPLEEDFPIVIVHPQAGYCLTTGSALAANPDVRLLEWGRLELVVTSRADSKINYHLRGSLRPGDERLRIRFHHEPVKDGDGRWIFECLPAGPAQLNAYGTPTNEGMALTIKDGRTSRIDLRTGRRAVIGRMQLPEGLPTQEPLVNTHLRRRSPRPTLPKGLSPEEQRAAFEAWRATPEGRAAAADHFDISFVIAPDGSFRIDDIVPGPCQLMALFLRSFPVPPGGKMEFAGFVAHEFDLPEGEGDFDLGSLPFRGPEGISSG
jgi:hypothetical protein